MLFYSANNYGVFYGLIILTDNILKRGGEMACGFSEKCRHYNAWWCDTNHNSCGTAKKFESDKSAAVSEKACGKEKNIRANKKKGGA